jgi:hypothetical protein
MRSFRLLSNHDRYGAPNPCGVRQKESGLTVRGLPETEILWWLQARLLIRRWWSTLEGQ